MGARNWGDSFSVRWNTNRLGTNRGGFCWLQLEINLVAQHGLVLKKLALRIHEFILRPRNLLLKPVVSFLWRGHGVRGLGLKIAKNSLERPNPGIEPPRFGAIALSGGCVALSGHESNTLGLITRCRGRQGVLSYQVCNS